MLTSGTKIEVDGYTERPAEIQKRLPSNGDGIDRYEVLIWTRQEILRLETTGPCIREIPTLEFAIRMAVHFEDRARFARTESDERIDTACARMWFSSALTLEVK